MKYQSKMLMIIFTFKKSDFYLLNSKHIEEVTTEYFSNPKQVEEVKLGLAKFWLDEINSHDIELT